MTIFLAILIGFSLYFDFSNGKSAFVKKKRRVNFIISTFFWYSVSFSLLLLPILLPKLQIWQYNNVFAVIIYIYFAVHFFRGMIIYNCQEDPMNSSNFEKN